MKATELITVVLFSACLAGQGKPLQRAILIEEQEHDLKQAVRLYEELASAATTADADKTIAWYRLGRGLRRLGQDEKAREALERAAKGEGPAAISARALLQDDGQDKEKVKKLRAKARAILDQRGGDTQEKLRWIGPAAVPEIIKDFADDWHRGDWGYANLVWELGGEHARAFLVRVARDKDALFRATVAQAIVHNHHPALLSVALQFLHDTALPGKLTLDIARQLSARAPVQNWVKLVRSSNPEVSAGAWKVLGHTWHHRDSEGQEAWMRLLIPELRAALDSKDPNTADFSRGFLRTHALRTVSGREFLLELLPSWPRNISPTFKRPRMHATTRYPASLSFARHGDSARTTKGTSGRRGS